MGEIERAASFYLGRLVNPDTGELGDILQYDARDLTTHAVCVGMTGSGKTGLCVDLLEEAALDQIPSIIIDPKGDLTNMLLTFPDLRPEDFLPWVNVDDARRKNMTVEEYAGYVANLWAKGLADSGQGPERIRQLKQSADFVIFTPGSSAGVPVNILQSFAVPDLSWEEHEEELREKISSIVSALLSLGQVRVDSTNDREHVLLSHLFERAWRAGEDLDLAALIMQVQKPPIRKLGVFDVDTYFPPAERMQLAMALNNVLASPSFAQWLEGVPLEIPQIIKAPDGRPRVAIFYIAHLSDAERMFFVTLLLQQVIGWMRTLSGTTSLRCILYFDEVFGYFPPTAEPPSKRPLLTLLKQARAFGLGVVLVTQNPMDLDYKGLTNAGTWFIGRLQAERDKLRMLEGLDTVFSSAGGRFDRAYFDKLISSLKPRQFILHNVNQDAPVVFYTRWAMSYLRGPLTKVQVKELMKGRSAEALKAAPAVQAPQTAPAPAAAAVTAPPAAKPAPGLDTVPPALPAGIPQHFLPVRLPDIQARKKVSGQVAETRLVYRPALLMAGQVQFSHTPSGTFVSSPFMYLLPPEHITAVPDWAAAQPLELTAKELETRGAEGALYADVPEPLANVRQFALWKKAFADYLYRTQALVISYHPLLKVYARPEDTAESFRRRCEEAARQQKEAEAEKIRAKYTAQIARLQERIRREELELEQDRLEYEARKQEELLSAGESLVGMFIGRRRTSVLSSASRRRRMTQLAKADLDESVATIAKLKKELEGLQRAMNDELEALEQRWAQLAGNIQEIRVQPRKTDIAVDIFGVGWAPMWQFVMAESGQRVEVPAYQPA
jgi:hypothetical protein